MLDPRTANVLKLSGLDVFLDSLEGGGVKRLEPFVLLSGGGGEAVFRVFVDQVALGYPRTDDFAFCLCEWPEPTGI